MLRRSPALSAALAAVVILAGRAVPARADGITYSLVNNTGQPVDQAVFTVAPSGALQGPPVTIDNPIPSVFNFATETQGGHPLDVSLGTSTDPNPKFDGLIFSFVPDNPNVTDPDGTVHHYNTQPLPSGDALDFTLNTAPGFTGTPTLSLFQPPNGLSLQVIKPTNQTPSPTVSEPKDAVPGPVNTPEPLSVLLWSTVAGAGLMRARKFRRATARG